MLRAGLSKRHIIPILTDVSLQYIPREYTFSQKTDLFHHILTTYTPPIIDIGKNTEILQYTKDYIKERRGFTEISAFVYSEEDIKASIQSGATHVSFMANNIDICKTIPENVRKKLYITTDFIEKIRKNIHLDELCVSDNYGDLTFTNYKNMIDTISLLDIPKSKLSFRLPVVNRNETYNIVRYGIKNGIIRFDVSTNFQTINHHLFWSMYKTLLEEEI